MSEMRSYPIEVIREQLGRHRQHARAAQGGEWLAEVVELLRSEAAVVPPPVERVDTIPEYVYPH